MNDSSAVVDVGTPPPRLSGNNWELKEVRFHDFANLPSHTHNYSPEFTCCGYKWCLSLQKINHQLRVTLCNKTTKDVNVYWGVSIRDAVGTDFAFYVATEERKRHFDAIVGVEDSDSWSTPNMSVNLVRLSDALEEGEGTLTVEVRMKRVDGTSSPTAFIPTNPINNNILKSFNDEESSDVVFEVESGRHEEINGKRLKITTNFYAHRLMLKDGAPLLAELCKPSADGGDAKTTVSISDIKPDIFKHMLFYLYGGKVTDEEMDTNAKDIINACDKYGMVHLKLEAEARYVKSTTIDIDNILDNLLYADSKNCALLKEAVMDYIVTNKNDVIGNVSFDDVPGSTVTDILTAMARGEQVEDDSCDNSINYNKMRVCTLRKMLDEKGLDVDGSREAMIALLKENAE